MVHVSVRGGAARLLIDGLSRVPVYFTSVIALTFRRLTATRPRLEAVLFRLTQGDGGIMGVLPPKV